MKSFVYLEDSRPVRRDQQAIRQVLPERPAGADDARGCPGARRFARRDHLHRVQRSRGESASESRPRACRTVPGVLAGDTLYVSGKGDQLRRRQSSRNLRGAGPAGDAKRRDDPQAGGVGLPACRHESRFPRQVRESRSGRQGLQRVLRRRQRACLRHRVRRLDSGRVACRGHVHRHDRPGDPQGRPAGRHETRIEPGRDFGEPCRLGGEHSLPVRAFRHQAAGGIRDGRAWSRRSIGWRKNHSPSSKRPG